MRKILLFGLMFFCFVSISCNKNQNMVNENNNQLQQTTEKENNDDIKTVYDFIKKCGIYYLATVENNKPRIRPFGTIDLFDNKIYFLTEKRKNVYKQMIANPKIEICAFDGDIWLRLEATAVNDNSKTAKGHIIEEMSQFFVPELKNIYQIDNDDVQVFYLKDATATFYSYTEAPKVVRF